MSRSDRRCRLRRTIRSLPVLVSCLLAASAPASEGSSADAEWRSGIVVLTAGQGVDLETGRVEPSGGAPRDVAVESSLVRFTRSCTPLRDFDRMLPQVSRQPWVQVRTSSGRLAAVQTLHAAPPFAIRYVVAPAGVEAWHPAPLRPSCRGVDGALEVRFDMHPSYVKYRIARRDGDQGRFVTLGAIERPPFIDRAVSPSVRYSYAIVGVTADGTEGLPAEPSASATRQGVFTGSARIFTFGSPREDRCLDFVLGRPDPTTFDLRFVGAFGPGGAKFEDSAGRPITSYGMPDDDTRLAWEVPSTKPGCDEIERGEPFHVLLRGGGVARCRFRYDPAPTDVPEHVPDIWVDYVVNLDSLTLPSPPKLAAARGADRRVILTLHGEPSGAPASVVVRGPGGEVRRTLPPGAADRPLAGEDYLTYSLAPAGHQVVWPTECVLDERTSGLRSGELELGCYLGWSFAAGSLVPAERADIVVSNFVGGAAGVTLTASGGIASIRSLTGASGTLVPAAPCFEAVVAAAPESVAWTRSDYADAQDPPADVLVLRCRSGGWAKLVVTGRRAVKGRWRASTVTVRYVFNAKEPVFGKGPIAAWRGGLALGAEFPNMDPRSKTNK